MSNGSWSRQQAFNACSCLLHVATVALLVSTWRQPSYQAPEAVHAPLARSGRRLQAFTTEPEEPQAPPSDGGNPGGGGVPGGLSGRLPPKDPPPPPVRSYRETGGGVGIRSAPGTAVAGPTTLPINQYTEVPNYAPGTGQVLDPLSCLWVNPETGTLFIKCKLTVEPMPFASSPPPKYTPERPSAYIIASNGSSGLFVAGDVAGTNATLFSVNEYDNATWPLARVERKRVYLTRTSIIHSSAANNTAGPALFVEGLKGEATVAVYEETNDLLPDLLVGGQEVATAPLSVYGLLGDPANPATTALTVVSQPNTFPLAAYNGGPDISAPILGLPSLRVGRGGDVTTGPIVVDPSRATVSRTSLTVFGAAGRAALAVANPAISSNIEASLVVESNGGVVTAPLIVDAAKAPALGRTTLQVLGTPSQPTARIASSAAAGSPIGLEIINNTVALGPTTISGGVAPDQQVVLNLAAASADQFALAAFPTNTSETPNVAIGATGLYAAAVQADSLAAGNLTTSGPAQFGGDVTVGSSTAGDRTSLTVTGKVAASQVAVNSTGTAGPALEVVGSANVSDTLAASKLQATDLDVSGSAVVSDTLSARSLKVQTDGHVKFSSDVTVYGTLTSVKLVVNGTGGAGPALQVNGSAAVTNAVSAGSLGVTGPAILAGDVAVGSGAAGQQRTLSVGGKLEVTGSASVSEALTTRDLTASGPATFTGGMTVGAGVSGAAVASTAGGARVSSKPASLVVLGDMTVGGTGPGEQSTLTVNGRAAVNGAGAAAPALQVKGAAAVGDGLSARNLTTSGPAKFGGDVVIGGAARGQQRGLTVTGRLNVKMDALFESSVEVWRSVTARWYFWWRYNRRHVPFTAPDEAKPTGNRKM